MAFRELPGRWTCWENSTPGEGMETLCPFLIPCSMYLFHLAVPELYPFLINWSTKYDVFLSTVSHFSKLINPGKGSWEPLIYSQSVRSTGNNLGLRLASEVGGGGRGGRQSCRTEPLTCGIWCYLPEDSVRIELNSWHSAGICELLDSVWKAHPWPPLPPNTNFGVGSRNLKDLPKSTHFYSSSTMLLALSL